MSVAVSEQTNPFEDRLEEHKAFNIKYIRPLSRKKETQLKMTDSRLRSFIPAEKLGIFDYEPEDPESFISKLKFLDESE